MYSNILDGITGRLDELFPDRPVYTDKEEQEPGESCFIVSIPELSERQVHGKRYFRETEAVIWYMPAASGGKQRQKEIYEVLEKLFEGMEYITLPGGNQMPGTKKKGRIEDGVLWFMANYDGFVIRTEQEEELMGSLSEDFHLPDKNQEK